MNGSVLIDTSAWIEFFRKGNTLGVVDLLIAQVAIENRLKLLTLDNHFKIIQKHSGLNLVAF